MQTQAANPTPCAESVAVPAIHPLFEMGSLCATPGAIDALVKNEQQAIDFLSRHVTGDWLELCDEDQQTNCEAVNCGARVFSAYAMKDGEKLWVITESDRSVTTLLLPSEY